MKVEDWSWAGGPNSIVLVEATGEIIARVLQPTDGGAEMQHARARFIAASPEIAEALCALADVAVSCMEVFGLHDAACCDKECDSELCRARRMALSALRKAGLR